MTDVVPIYANSFLILIHKRHIFKKKCFRVECRRKFQESLVENSRHLCTNDCLLLLLFFSAVW